MRPLHGTYFHLAGETVTAQTRPGCDFDFEKDLFSQIFAFTNKIVGDIWVGWRSKCLFRADDVEDACSESFVELATLGDFLIL